jgi:hypothetical protein
VVSQLPRQRSERRPLRPERLLRSERRPLLLGEIAVVVLLVWVYDRIRDIAQTRATMAMDDARRVLHIESWLHIDGEHAFNDWLGPHLTLQWVACWYYQLMHLTVTLLVLVWLYLRRPVAYRSARNSLVLVNAIGLAVFWLVPVAPPRLLGGFVDSGVVSGITSTVTHVSPDLYAAMPSLHIGWATWVLLQVFAATTNRVARGLVAAHLVITTVVVIATANHFVLDVAAGAAVALLAVAGARVIAVAVAQRAPANRPERLTVS